MGRTTVKLDDDLFRRLEERAAREGRSLQTVANDLLRQALHPPKTPPFALNLLTFRAELRPGIDLCDRNHLIDRIEEL